jgi:lipopolysaccharide heptosyltransferase II
MFERPSRVHELAAGGRIIAAALGIAPGARPDPARILLGLLMPIGDTLFAQPAIAAVRRRFPAAHLTALTYAHTAPLVAANPAIDDVIAYNADPALDFITRFDSTLRAIHARRFDMMINFSTGSNCVGILTGIPRQVWQRLPFVFWIWGAAFTPHYAEQHVVDHYWDVVADLGLTPRDDADRIPRWQVSGADRAAIRAVLTQAGIDLAGARPLVLLHPGAAGFGGRKRWPEARFGELAARLIAERDAQVVVLGGREDIAFAEVILAATDGRARSLAGQLALRESVAAITQADLYIGNDSGLTHFSVALGVPTVALYGVSDLAQFAPRAADPRRLRVVLPQPLPPPAGFFIGTESGMFAPRHPPDDRMATITVARVLAAAASLLPAPAPALVPAPVPQDETAAE